MKLNMDMKDELLTRTKLIENVEVVYPKKKKHHGELASVKTTPFEVKISDEGNKENHEHLIDFDLAERITLRFFDGTIKTYQDEIV